jgi:hypothetical protein
MLSRGFLELIRSTPIRSLIVRRLPWLLTLVALAIPRIARADGPGAHTVPVAVLAFDSDDAEEQADAITGAIRSRVRGAQGWTLIETTQSLGMLTAAMKCPSRPPPECQQRIAEQIKSDRYIWGIVSKGPSSGQVTAEIHLYQKGKIDTVLKESYADNLKDSNDDTLHKIAGRIVERLGGVAIGIVLIRTNNTTGDIVIDGEKRIALDKGAARVELAAGSHSIELAATGEPSLKRNVLVTAGAQTAIDFSPTTTTEPPREESKGNTRKIIGGITMGAGVVLGAIAVYEAIHWSQLQDDGKEAAAKVATSDPPVQCRNTGNAECVRIDRDSKTASGLAIGLGAGGAVALGVGAYLFFSDSGSSETKAEAPKPKTRIIPSVGVGSGSVTVLGTF